MVNFGILADGITVRGRFGERSRVGCGHSLRKILPYGLCGERPFDADDQIAMGAMKMIRLRRLK